MAKQKQKSMKGGLIGLCLLVLFAVIWFLTPTNAGFKQANTWQRATSPGRLSAAHASLEDNCAACHTPVTGVDPVNCISCHADNMTLLEGQSTAFHAHVGTCKDCHLEHRGRGHRPTTMDHSVFAKVGLRQAEMDADGGASAQRLAQLRTTIKHINEDGPPHARISRDEAILNCVTCHSTADPHAGYFGNDCTTCHSTKQWTILEYTHPSGTSLDCAQCHKTPPGHKMPMFLTMCAKSLGKSPKSVKQCYVCHTVYSWNDMKGAPWHREKKSHRASRD
jgi:hypothetical protein